MTPNYNRLLPTNEELNQIEPLSLFEFIRRGWDLVAGAGFEPTTFGL